uniref:Uncharacterized protein n=1 Tax=Cucumis melo TaxID=3656 RepID=A0A9I9EC60_CUCME
MLLVVALLKWKEFTVLCCDLHVLHQLNFSTNPLLISINSSISLGRGTRESDWKMRRYKLSLLFGEFVGFYY